MALPATMQMMGHLGPAAGAVAKSKVDTKVISEGITASFGIVTFRGKVWRLKYRGDETALLMPPAVSGGPQTTPVPTLDVIIVHASPTIAKIFYEGTYSEGDDSPPDCFSVNGVKPDEGSAKKQNALCATCPKNQWGSKTMPSGKPGKACQDSKRLVVVPAGDINNELFGGPMLLRVPPASLQDMTSYSNMLEQHGHTFFSVRTQLGFDHQMAYPKLTFTPLVALSENEVDAVITLQEDPRTKRILTEPVEPPKTDNAVQIGGTQTIISANGAAAPQPTPAVYTPPPAAAGQPYPAETAMQVAAAQQDLAGDPGPMPTGLMRITAPAPVQQAVQEPAAPQPAAFRVLTPAEMAALPPDQMVPYMTALSAHFAAQQAQPVVQGGRRRRTTTVAATAAVPPPSPAPTQEAVPQPVQPVVQQVAPANPFAAAAGTAMVGSTAPNGAASPDDAAVMANLNAKLGALLG